MRRASRLLLQVDIATLVGGPGITTDPIPSGAADAVRANTAQFMVFDSGGNLYFSTTGNNDVEVLYAGGTVPPVLAAEGTKSPRSGYVYQIAGGNPTCTFASATPGTSCGDGGPAVGQSILNYPQGIAVDAAGNLFIADQANGAIRKVSASDGKISSVAGSPFSPGYSPDGTTAATAQISNPTGLLLDVSGNLYYTEGNLVRVLYSSGAVPTLAEGVKPQAGKLYTVAGVEADPGGYNGDGAAATSSDLNAPFGLALDSNGNLYIADAYNNLIRMVSSSTQTLNTVVGDTAGAGSGSNTCSAAPCGDGGSPLSALLNFPYDVRVDGTGDILISDNGDTVIRKVAGGVISTVAGQEQQTGYSGDNASAPAATLTYPNGIALDSEGNLYIADSGNMVVREVGQVGGVAFKPQSISFSPLPAVTYSSSTVPLSANSSSGLPVIFSVQSGPAQLSPSGTSLMLTGAGTVIVQANQAGDSTYAAAAQVSQSFAVRPAVLAVTANNVSLSVGTVVNPALFPEPHCTVTGLVGTDTVRGDCSIATTATGKPPVGSTYPITPSLGTLSASPAGNYVVPFTFIPGTLSIAGNLPQTINFPALPATIFAYGNAPVPLGATSSSGLAVSYTATGSATVTGSASAGYKLSFTGVGPGSVTATQAGNADYASATPSTQVFQVTPILVTVKANNVTVPFGSPVNATQLTYTITPTQLANGDVLTGTPSLSTAATATSAQGSTFPISVAQGTLALVPATSAAFYAFNLQPGVLTIGQGVQSIVFPSPATPPSYGKTITLNASASSGLPITYHFTGQPVLSTNTPQNGVLSTGSTFVSAGPVTLTCVDVGSVTITASQAGNSSYQAAPPVVQTLTAGPATLVVTLATSTYTRPVGGENPNFAYTIDPSQFQFGDTDNASTVQGQPDITTTATVTSPAGTYPITLSPGTLVSPKGRYTFAFQGGTLDVTAPPSYILTVNPGTLNIPTGHSQQTTIIASPVSGESPYQGTIALSCAGLPAGVSCTFSPATLTLALGSAGTTSTVVQSTLTVDTGGGRPTSSLLFFPGGLLGVAIAVRRRRIRPVNRGRSSAFVLIVMALSTIAGITACGGPSSSPPLQGIIRATITGTATGTAGTGSPNVVVTLPLTINVTK